MAKTSSGPRKRRPSTSSRKRPRWCSPPHTERIDRLPRFIEYLFNTPSHHRVHHGANNPYLDKNYSGILIIWDRIFGSYAEETEPVRYGLTKNIGRNDPITVNFHEFGRMLRDVWRARTWRGRVGYLLRPPSWTEPESHVGDGEKRCGNSFQHLTAPVARDLTPKDAVIPHAP